MGSPAARDRGGLDQTDRAEHRDRPGDRPRARAELLAQLGRGRRLDSPWQLTFGVLPAYWPVRAFWSAYDGGSYRPYVAVGLLYNAALVAALLRVVTRRLR